MLRYATLGFASSTLGSALVSLSGAAVLCYAMPCCAMQCYAMLCHAVLCYAMPRYATLRYAMLCYAMLCYAMLRYATQVFCSKIGLAPYIEVALCHKKAKALMVTDAVVYIPDNPPEANSNTAVLHAQVRPQMQDISNSTCTLLSFQRHHG